jgi:signal transduction histidine kinase
MGMKNPRIGNRTRQMIFPSIFLFAGAIIAIIYHTVFEPRGANLDGLLFYGALSLTSFTLIILFQRFVDYKSLHIPLSIGWGLVFLGSFEKLNNDVVNTVGLENENFFSAVIFFGLLFVAFGLYLWVRQTWMNERYREQQHRVIEMFTSLMSHDAGNDLQAVLGYLELAIMRCQECPHEVLEVLEAAREFALRMTTLIQSFKTGVIDTELSLVEVLQSISNQAEKAHLGLRTNIAADAGTESISGAGNTLFAMAVTNIFRNAAEHAGPKPIVDIEVSRSANKIIIVLNDNGPGIPHEQRKSLFQRGSSKKEHGLGLYLTKQIVTACGGTIENLESEKGAKFRIALPIIP